MTSRVLVIVAPCFLVAVAVGAGASCSSSSIHPTADGGLTGTGGTSHTSSHSTTATTSSSTSAGTGGAGTGGAGTGGTGTGGMATGGMDGGTDGGGDGGTGAMCKKAGDCQSMVCTAGMCVAPTCMDGVENGDETDVDCGGSCMTKCGTGKKCGSIAANCQSKICTNGTCVAATCTDNVQNGNETDIDCGGGPFGGAPACPLCNPGQKCALAADCAGGSCSGTCQCPSGMVTAPLQAGGIDCVDANEVAEADYNTFLGATVKYASQRPECMWNQSWVPSVPITMAQLAFPVQGVNWCQADAYCRYIGKRLCGQHGGGSVPQASFKTPNLDQWYNACSVQGTRAYAYGNSYDGNTCVDVDHVPALFGPQSPAMFQACAGGAVGLFEMSGNVAEWEDSCNGTAGPTDTCAVRGGSYLDGANGLRCDSGQAMGPVTQPRNYAGGDVGIRCCL